MARNRGIPSVRQRKNKNGELINCWESIVNLDKKRIPIYGKTQEECESKLLDALIKIEQNTFEKPINSKSISMSEWLVVWMQKYKKVEIKDTTYNNYLLLIAKYINTQLGHFYIQNINKKILKEYYLEKINEGISKNTIRCIHVIIHSALKKAVENKIIDVNVSDNLLSNKNNGENEKNLLNNIEEILIKQSYKTTREYTVKYGRIDLIAEKKNEIIVIEGKSNNGINKLSGALGQLLLYRECIPNCKLYLATPKKPNNNILEMFKSYDIRYYDELIQAI